MGEQKRTILDIIIFSLLVITFLGWFCWPIVKSDPEYPKLNTTKAKIHTLQMLLAMYNSDKGVLPPENNGLALVIKEYNEDDSLLLDGWGNKFLYKITDKWIYIISLGADGKKGGTDLDEDIGTYGLWD